MSPAGRSLDLLRRCGFIACPVERFIAHANVREDAFSVGDLLVVHPLRREIVLIQSTTRANMSSRLKKARGIPELACWLAAGGRLVVHGWRRRGGRWECFQLELTRPDLAAVVVTPRWRRGRRPVQRGLFDGDGGGSSRPV